MLTFLREKLLAVEKQMQAKLLEVRATFKNSGIKGTSAEETLRGFLRQYLSRRYGVGHGEIVDSKGGRSLQTDVVVATEDHPFTFSEGEPGLFFVEGVAAAGEVKMMLTSDELEKALNNALLFKRLRMQPGEGTMIHSTPSDIRRFYECPPWFLFAYESNLTLETVRKKIVEFGNDHKVDINYMADAVFALDRGWVTNFGDGQGALKSIDAEGKSVPGWVAYPSETILYDFLGWLSAVMPRMIRFEAIISRYTFPVVDQKRT